MNILKFGGSSLQDTDCRQRVIDLVQAQHGACWVVVSAFGDATDQLATLAELAAYHENTAPLYELLLRTHKDAANALLEDASTQKNAAAYIDSLFADLKINLDVIAESQTMSPKHLAAVLATGELLSAYILSCALSEKTGGCQFIDARELIVTDSHFANAAVDFEATNKKIQNHYKKTPQLAVITGFIARDTHNATTTLGRGGSDYTASIVGAALDVDCVYLYTDVDGVMTADPRRVPSARVLEHISYQEAMELSHFGATVLHPATMTPLIKKNIPIQIRNTFNPEHSGTRINRHSSGDLRQICGLSSQTGVALLTIEGPGLQGISGTAARVFGCLAEANINIILITQASSEHSICFVVREDDAVHAEAQLANAFADEIAAQRVAPIHCDHSVCIIAVVGENMRQRIGIAGKLFYSISRVNVNIIAIAQGASELNVSLVIRENDETIALRALHAGFFEHKEPLQLFVFGATGLIGSTLINQLKKFNSHTVDLQLYGLANTQAMTIATTALSPTTALDELRSPTNSSISNFIDKVKAESHLPRRVFVDCSANDDVTNYYATLLKDGISVVTPNKHANAGPWRRYEEIMQSASQVQSNYHYEVTVGAALPIIQTIKNLVATGDTLHRIEAVLSGSLNYIFSTFSRDSSFASVVSEAKTKGFTEPDPREDLGGLDVARKLLILLREWGYTYELSDIDIESLVPTTCTYANTIDDFFQQLQHEPHLYHDLVASAESEHKVLRYSAYFDGTRAAVGLQSYAETHPFYRLQGSNNMLILTTDRYRDAPLIIEGPGAGADVTAAGVLADILTLAGALQ